MFNPYEVARKVITPFETIVNATINGKTGRRESRYIASTLVGAKSNESSVNKSLRPKGMSGRQWKKFYKNHRAELKESLANSGGEPAGV